MSEPGNPTVHLARKLYWTAVLLSAFLFAAGIRIVPPESVLASLFTSALAYPVSSFIKDSREGGGARGAAVLNLAFSLWALAMLLGLLFVLRLFVIDFYSIAGFLLFLLACLMTEKGESEFASLADSFAIASLFLVVQQPTIALSPGQALTTGFFFILSFALMSGGTAYKFRDNLGKRLALIPVIALPIAYLAILYELPFFAAPVAVVYLAIPQLIREFL